MCINKEEVRNPCALLSLVILFYSLFFTSHFNGLIPAVDKALTPTKEMPRGLGTLPLNISSASCEPIGPVLFAGIPRIFTRFLQMPVPLQVFQPPNYILVCSNFENVEIFLKKFRRPKVLIIRNNKI